MTDLDVAGQPHESRGPLSVKTVGRRSTLPTNGSEQLAIRNRSTVAARRVSCPSCGQPMRSEDKHDDAYFDAVCPSCCTDCVEPVEVDCEPIEPTGSEDTWRCALYGCSWWVWETTDRILKLAGWQHVPVRRYTPPPPTEPQGQLFA